MMVSEIAYMTSGEVMAKLYSIDAYINGDVNVSGPETLGQAFQAYYRTLQAAEAAVSELEADIPEGHENVEYVIWEEEDE